MTTIVRVFGAAADALPASGNEIAGLAADLVGLAAEGTSSAIKAMPEGAMSPRLSLEALTMQTRLTNLLETLETSGGPATVRGMVSAPVHDTIIGAGGAEHLTHLRSVLDQMSLDAASTYRAQLMPHVPYIDGLAERARSAATAFGV